MKLRARLALTLVALAVPLVAGAVWLRIELGRRGAVESLVDFARVRMVSGGKEACEASPTTFQEPPLQLRPRDGGPPWLRGPRGPEDRGPEGRNPEGRGPEGRGPDGRGLPGPGPQGLGPQGPEGRPLDPVGPEGRPLDRRAAVAAAVAATNPRVELWAYGPDFQSANPRAPKFPADLRARLEAGEREAGFVTTDSDVRVTTIAARMDWSEGPCAIVTTRRLDPKPPNEVLVDGVSAGALVALLVAGVLVAVGPILRRVRKLEDGVRRAAATRYHERVAVEGADEIADLARAFDTAGAEVREQIEVVEKRERALRNFVENTTHDVMLPLTVLQGHLTRMRNELSRGATPERETVRDALEESHYLASLVQNLGAAAKLEGGEPRLRRDPFSWNALVERVILRHRTIASEKGVALDFAVPPDDVRAEGDVTLVEQALSNVVHNAVRYNRSGGHVAVLLESRDGRFGVRVFDDGPGVSEAELARISERSYRSDAARARHPDGLGLGLSIAKDVADRHGFAIRFGRAEAGGLEVEFSGAISPPTGHVPR